MSGLSSADACAAPLWCSWIGSKSLPVCLTALRVVLATPSPAPFAPCCLSSAHRPGASRPQTHPRSPYSNSEQPSSYSPAADNRHRCPVTFLLDRQRPDDARHASATATSFGGFSAIILPGIIQLLALPHRTDVARTSNWRRSPQAAACRRRHRRSRATISIGKSTPHRAVMKAHLAGDFEAARSTSWCSSSCARVFAKATLSAG